MSSFCCVQSIQQAHPGHRLRLTKSHLLTSDWLGSSHDPPIFLHSVAVDLQALSGTQHEHRFPQPSISLSFFSHFSRHWPLLKEHSGTGLEHPAHVEVEEVLVEEVEEVEVVRVDELLVEVEGEEVLVEVSVVDVVVGSSTQHLQALPTQRPDTPRSAESHVSAHLPPSASQALLGSHLSTQHTQPPLHSDRKDCSLEVHWK